MKKAQLDFILSGELDKLGEVNSPSLNEGSTLNDILLAIAQAVTEELRKSATLKQGVATKELRSGIDTTDVTESADSISVGIVMPPQWRWAEYGRKKGKMPPIKSIEDWITAKGIRVRQSKAESKQTVLDRRRAMAFVIARKISKSGTIKRFGYKGSKFIQDVLTPDTMQTIANAIGMAAGKKIEIYLKSK